MAYLYFQPLSNLNLNIFGGSMNGIIVSILNNKGGCGKTTTAVNLAAALGKKDKKVLVIDIDTQCNATAKLLPDVSIIRKSLYEIIDPKEDINPKDAIYPTKIKNVFILPNIELSGSLEPDMIMNAPKSLFALNKSLRAYAIENFDITIIDNPPNFGSFVLCSLNASDFALVPIKAGSTDSVEGLLKAVNLIKGIRTSTNPDLKFLRVLVGYFDKRTAMSKAIADEIYKSFEGMVFETVIPTSTTFEKAESLGTTIFNIAGGATPGAKAYRKLSDEFLSVLEA